MTMVMMTVILMMVIMMVNGDGDVPLLSFSLGCLNVISISLMKQKTSSIYGATERRSDGQT